jgi:putative transposase
VDVNFTASSTNQLRVAAITFLPTAVGFLYLTVVLDARSRRIVGWAMATRLHAEPVLNPFRSHSPPLAASSSRVSEPDV